jgi:signal transduction histidine kinase
VLIAFCDNIRSHHHLTPATLNSLEDYARGALGAMTQSIDRRRQRERRADDRAWQDLAQRIAHRLDNIVPFTESALLDTKTLITSGDPHALVRLEQAIADAKQCRKIVREFKKFAARLVITPKPLEVSELDKLITNWLGGRASLDISRQTRGEMVSIDTDHFAIALRELAQNSDRAIEQGEMGNRMAKLAIEIRFASTEEIRQQSLETGGRWLAIRFDDDGPGIPKANQTQIFEPLISFTQGGTGLGLAEVRKIIEGHSGKIVVSVPKYLTGASFTIFLPVVFNNPWVVGVRK